MNYDKAISEIKDRWEEIKEETQKEYEIVDALYNTWIKPLTPAYFFSKDGRDTLLIIFPDGQDFMIDYIEHKYHNFIKTTIESVTGIDVEIEFSTIAHSEQKNVNGAPVTMSALNSNLNPKYTFDTFVVGANNKFAHAASLAVAESPAERYNPLFIYGGVGLGKTHLMHSIAHYILKNKPDARILYITSGQFTNELIDAIIETGHRLYIAANGKLQRAQKAGDIYVCKNFTVHVFRQNASGYQMAEYPGVALRVPNNLPAEKCKPHAYGYCWEDVAAEDGNPFYIAAQFLYDSSETKQQNLERALEFMKQVRRGDYFQMSAE